MLYNWDCWSKIIVLKARVNRTTVGRSGKQKMLLHVIMHVFGLVVIPTVHSPSSQNNILKEQLDKTLEWISTPEAFETVLSLFCDFLKHCSWNKSLHTSWKHKWLTGACTCLDKKTFYICMLRPLEYFDLQKQLKWTSVYILIPLYRVYTRRNCWDNGIVAPH